MPTKTRRARIDADNFDDDEDTRAPWTNSDDDEDEPPVRRRRRPEPVDDEDDAQVASDEDDETVIPQVSRGRKEIKSHRRSGGPGIFFRWPDDGETAVVKFLDADPWSYQQHWVNRSAGRRSFPCIGKGCPLCEVGEKKSERVVYSIVNLSMDEPMVQILEVSPTLDDTLAAHDADKKTGPLHNHFWALSRAKGARSSGSFLRYNYQILPVKTRDLLDDYEINPKILDDIDQEPIEPEQALGKVTKRMLQEVADEVELSAHRREGVPPIPRTEPPPFPPQTYRAWCRRVRQG